MSVLNVGANPGQYAAGFRKAANKGCIISLEPLPGPFPVLESKASTDPLWDCQQCALGDGDGTISINVAGNVGQRSSVLSMLKSHQDFYAAANYIGPEEVPIHRLDSGRQQFYGRRMRLYSRSTFFAIPTINYTFSINSTSSSLF